MKRKVFLGVIIVLIVVIGGFLTFLKTTQIASADIITEETGTEEILEENVITENELAEENIVDTTQIADTQEVVAEVPTENLEETKAQETVKTTTKAETKKQQTQPQSQSEMQAPVVQAQQPEPVVVASECKELQPTLEASTQLQINSNTPKEENTSNSNNESQTNETKNTVQENTYVYNAQMTQRLVDTINSNPSEMMKTYGFTVTIDSSITSLTNQFTFFENRVIEKIQNKAGNIRVYAQDYYYYGEYLFTECYII